MVNDSKQEQEKLRAETDKLCAEADHFRTGAAVFGVMIGTAKMFGGA